MPPGKASTSSRNKSICQKSGEIAATLTKISSLYLATFLLPRNRKSAAKSQPQRQSPKSHEVRSKAAYVEQDDAVDTHVDEYIRGRRVSVFGQIDDGVRNETLNCISPPPPPKNNYTIISNNYFAGYSLPTLAQASPPVDKITIFGDGNTKGVFVDEDDIGIYTIKAANDPRTLNKIVYIRPPGCIYSHNELISLWEKKTGKTLERIYLSDEEIFKIIQEAPIPFNVIFALNYLVFVKGDCLSFEIDPAIAAEATELYPEVKYTTVEEYLSRVL
ncbi:isoflavone reductase-like protein [Phalaenopsis equestris]|uniref:isoflavone reductase-like protein n=1 Tax=Phalaenopsis equestris TaxID=78828 RepID=UPI0009E4E976|nr:isoflavone reductase-like protein [Phalaenopsis equestris]